MDLLQNLCWIVTKHLTSLNGNVLSQDLKILFGKMDNINLHLISVMTIQLDHQNVYLNLYFHILISIHLALSVYPF